MNLRVNQRRVAQGLCSLALFAPPVALGTEAPAAALLGELPRGAVSWFEVGDVGAEVCRTHLFSPTAISARMPPGYRLATLSDKASTPAVAAIIRERPEISGYARGAFCFLESGVYTVNGRPLYPGRRGKVAFLWADMVPEPAAAKDERFRGDLRRVQLFWVYDNAGVDRKLAQSATPDALFGDIVMEKRGESWLVAIKGADSSLTAKVMPTTERKALVYPLPAFETLPLAQSADHFSVVTFAGHHDRRATGHWSATGDAPWARIFADGMSADGGSFIQDGWAARVGIYRYKQKP